LGIYHCHASVPEGIFTKGLGGWTFSNWLINNLYQLAIAIFSHRYELSLLIFVIIIVTIVFISFSHVLFCRLEIDALQMARIRILKPSS